MQAPGDAIGRYLLAVAREAELSTFWGRYLGVDGRLLRIPNAFAHRRRLAPIAPLLRASLPLLGVLWALVGLPSYAIAWALRWTVTGTWPERVRLPVVVYLHASNDRNVTFVPAEAGRPDAALTLPWWTGAAPGPWARQRIDLRAVSSRETVWRAAWLSVRAGLQLLRRPHRDQVLFSYSAPGWMWVHEVLAAASDVETIWMSNHVDRWASLATSFSTVSAVIVQHGDLSHWDTARQRRLVPALMTKLHDVQRVYVTDAESAEDFIAAVTGPGPQFTRIELGMHQVPWEVDAGVARVIVIGHPDAQEPIGAVLHAIDQRASGQFAFAYRPHPTESLPVALPHVSMDRVTVTGTGSTVPASDVVLSYGSSVTGEIVRATDAMLVRWDPNNAASVRAAVDAVIDAALRRRPTLGVARS